MEQFAESSPCEAITKAPRGGPEQGPRAGGPERSPRHFFPAIERRLRQANSTQPDIKMYRMDT
jgi:hypothetical protein